MKIFYGLVFFRFQPEFLWSEYGYGILESKVHAGVPEHLIKKQNTLYRCAQSSVGYAESGFKGAALRYEFPEYGGHGKLSGRSFDIFHDNYGAMKWDCGY
jgi:hypothetical protein